MAIRNGCPATPTSGNFAELCYDREEGFLCALNAKAHPALPRYDQWSQGMWTFSRG